MTCVDYLSGPHGQILSGFSSENMSFNAESGASPSGEAQLCTRARRSPIRTRVDQPTRQFAQKQAEGRIIVVLTFEAVNTLQRSIIYLHMDDLPCC